MPAPSSARPAARPAVRPLLLAAALAAVAGCQPAPSGPVNESGDLATGDLTLAGGEFYDARDVQMAEGQWLRADLRATGFDPYLIVRTPSGEQSEMDDSTPGDTTRTVLTLQAAEAGTFDLLVTTFQAGETGSYELTYEVSDTEPAGAATAAPAADPDTSAAP